jgi:hypothetical protein
MSRIMILTIITYISNCKKIMRIIFHGGDKVKIYVTVKSLAKKKNYITKDEVNIQETPATLRKLIAAIVIENVQEFNNQKTEMPIISYLSKSDIELKGLSGKIGFNSKYNKNVQDADEASDVAITAFQDGLYKVFIEENEISDLDEPLVINDEAEVAFIKFTMLAGRMW